MNDAEYEAELAKRGWKPTGEFCQEGRSPWCSSAVFAAEQFACEASGWGATLAEARRAVLARVEEREALRKTPA